MRSCCCLCACQNSWTNLLVYETRYVYHDTWAPLNCPIKIFFPPVCVSACVSPIVARQRLDKSPLIVARQRLGRNVTAVMNTHTTIEELLDASFPMWPVSCQKSRRLVLPSTSCSYFSPDYPTSGSSRTGLARVCGIAMTAKFAALCKLEERLMWGRSARGACSKIRTPILSAVGLQRLSSLLRRQATVVFVSVWMNWVTLRNLLRNRNWRYNLN
jgi:hypothetical protein